MKNEGSTLEYRLLAHSAKHAGMISPTVSLDEAEKQIRVFDDEVKQTQKLLDFPLRCLQDDLTKVLFQISLEEEQLMAPEWFKNQGGESVFRAAYDAFKDSGSLCSVNITQVLDNRDWKAFLQGIV